MYDDPPTQETTVNPYYRSHKTPVFKTDHQELSYQNPGHLMRADREKLMEIGQARMYQTWTPPSGGERRDGKKIIDENRPVNDGKAFKEQD